MKSNRPITDYCNICGIVKPLSEDHVPPKFWNNHKPKRFSLAFGTLDPAQAKSMFPYKAYNGISYRTICSECNNKLGGSYDKELQRFCEAIAHNLKCDIYVPFISVDIRVNRVTRGVVGHLLAAKNFYDTDCLVDVELRKYLIDDTALPPTDMHLYCYPYQHKNIVVGRDLVPMGVGVPQGMISIISSFPVSFILTDVIVNGMTDLFAKCTNEIDEKKNIILSRRSACIPGTNILRNFAWPINISNDGTPCVLGELASESLVIAEEV